MSKTLFAVVKELIAEKKYAEARAVLKTIKHPTAREIEVRLDDIDPPSIDLFEREPVHPHQKSAALKTLFIFGGIVILCILSLIIMAYLPAYSLTATRQAVYEARRRSQDETRVAYFATETALPIRTSTPQFSSNDQLNQTRTAISLNKTEAFNAIMGTANANLDTSNTFYSTIPPRTTATDTPMPTPFISVSPTSYYVLINNTLSLCPEIGCGGYGPNIWAGNRVEVVGIVEGGSITFYASNTLNTSNKWYVIRIPGNEGTYYQFVDNFDDFTLSTPIPSRTLRPTFSPTSTARP